MRWLLVVCLLWDNSWGVDPGPWYKATKGAVWPHPRYIIQSEAAYRIDPDTFTFKVLGKEGDILRTAIDRYHKVLKKNAVGLQGKHWKKAGREETATNLDRLVINSDFVHEDYPYLHMNESYELQINTKDYPEKAFLNASSIWGVLRGLETFVQLTFTNDTSNNLWIKSCYVDDSPRFSHRGLMLDTARHFLPKNVILTMMDAMEANKLNVLHWHIVDDQSFPFQSTTYPSLSNKGAYHSRDLIYTHQDVKDIVEYGRMRGIRVMPEFDSPGHTRSWGEGIPELLTKCYTGAKPNGDLGPIDPTIPSNYHIIGNLFTEIIRLFPDKYIHLGGDEVDFTCWHSNPNITDFMVKHNIVGDYAKLEDFYIQKIVRMVDELKAKSVVWQEVYQHGVILPKNTLVHIWTGDQENLLHDVTSHGYSAILSTCWYLDHVAQDLYGGGGDWRKFYNCEPLSFPGTDEQKRLVVGGEACMWAEYVDETNVIARVWPRASAAAEKLWSTKNINNAEVAAHRLEEHVCRMRRRGVNAQPPNGPSVCL